MYTEQRRDALPENILTYGRIKKTNKNLYTSTQLINRCKTIFFALVSRNWPNYEADKSPCPTEADRGNAESGTASNVIDLILRFSDRQTLMSRMNEEKQVNTFGEIIER